MVKGCVCENSMAKGTKFPLYVLEKSRGQGSIDESHDPCVKIAQIGERSLIWKGVIA